jgi:caffeoyl-CoA O-methyltransferase
MSSRFLKLDETLYRYVLDHSVREHPAQAALREATRTHAHAGMQISPDQAQLMALLVKLIGARRTIEIGVFTGYSACASRWPCPMTAACWRATSTTTTSSVGRPHWQAAGVAHKIDVQLAPALQTLDARIAAGEEGRTTSRSSTPTRPRYDAYYERCLRLLRTGGLIAIDNVLWSGAGRPLIAGCRHAGTASPERQAARRRAHRHRHAGDQRRRHAGPQALRAAVIPRSVTSRCASGRRFTKTILKPSIRETWTHAGASLALT